MNGVAISTSARKRDVRAVKIFACKYLPDRTESGWGGLSSSVEGSAHSCILLHRGNGSFGMAERRS
jgi:hypothetical protein